MLVLGIETSCDETALALVADGKKILATQTGTSLPLHQRYGGVVPEIASRSHVELITAELEALLATAKVLPSDLDRIAVTHGPGLSGSLIVGIACAKALSIAWGKEVVGVNHLRAHLYAAFMEEDRSPLDVTAIGLVISGGHTVLVRMSGIERVTLLGQTRDDAVGEAFDKVAKLLGLGFPGGPEIERVAKEGNPKAFRFSTPKIRGGSPYDFSFSGIKTAVLYKVRECERATTGTGKESCQTEKGFLGDPPPCLLPQWRNDLAASFQHSIVEEVVMKSVAACRAHRIKCLAVGGGVIANARLRDRLKEVCSDFSIELAVPPLSLCTDNGIMVAGLGYHGEPVAPGDLSAIPDLRVELN